MNKFKNYSIKAVCYILVITLFTNCSTNKKKPGAEKSWKFAVTGDCRDNGTGTGVNENILGKIAVAISNEQIDFVLFNGDICYGHANRKEIGDSAALKRLEEEFKMYLKTMQPVYSMEIPVYNVRGNHETTQRNPDHSGYPDHRPVWPETKKIWDKVFSGKYSAPGNGPVGEENVTFSFIHKNALIIGMDVYSTPVPGTKSNADGSIPYWAFNHVNQSWLDKQLDGNKHPHIFTFSHEPAFKVDHADCLHGNSSFSIDYSKDRDVFWKSIARARSRTYFCGHDHGYAHSRIDDGDNNIYNDVHQFVVGTA
ncbi:MAG: metallophosphoesterase, partial [Mariniphaga sp.]|nr:metallophosphoesterase [Mariniphaga sp.]